MRSQGTRYFATAVFGLFALAHWAMGITQIVEARHWIRTATRVTGKVVDVVREDDATHLKSRDAETNDWVVEVAYEVDGEIRYVTCTSTVFKWLYKPGQDATVLYTPGKPDDALLYSAWNSNPHLYGSWIVMLCLGLMCAIGSIVCFKMLRDF